LEFASSQSTSQIRRRLSAERGSAFPAAILANRTPAIFAIVRDFLSPRGGRCALPG